MNILELNNIERYFGKNKVLDNLCVSVPKGKIYGFLGRNGAGKTTTIKVILGLIQYHGGHIRMNGRDMSGNGTAALGRMGSIVEFPGFYPNLSGLDNLKAFQWLYGFYNKKEIDAILKIVGLSESSNKNVGTYSLGMKQRLGVARALLNDPDILILDEPNNGLDPSGIREMRKMLKFLSTEHGKTIFLSSHILSEIEQIVDVIGILKNGRMIEEIAIDALRDQCVRGLKIKVSNPQQARQLLKQQKQIECTYQAEDGILLIDHYVDAGEVNNLLVGNGFTVSMIMQSSLSLEEYFLNITT